MRERQSVDDFEPALDTLDIVAHPIHAGLKMGGIFGIACLIPPEGRDTDF